MSQKLALLCLEIQCLAGGASASETLAGAVAHLFERAADIADDVHHLAHDLYPPKLEILGLARAIESLSHDISSRCQVRIAFRPEAVDRRLPSDAALCLFRISQEALQKVVKHSGATTATVRLRFTVWLFAANDDFLASDDGAPGDRRTQAPMGALELHVSYDVNPRLWISTDFNYRYGGRVSVNGEEHLPTLQANSRLGVTASVPVSRRQSLKISCSDGVVVRFGGNFKTLSVGCQYGWFGLPFRTSADQDR